MIPRYSHPIVSELWSDRWTYDAWLEIERNVLARQRQLDTFDYPGTGELMCWLALVKIDPGACEAIRTIEGQTKHDVAAFLEWLRQDAPHGQYIHFGLTSSDIVDTAQGMRFLALHRPLLSELGNLISEITRLTMDETPMVGRTHGQVAEPTSMRARAWHWLAMLEPAITDLSKYTRRMQVCKLSGPVGTFAHNPPELEVRVAIDLELRPMGAGASQVVPRSDLAGWASAAARFAAACHKIATDLRLLNLTGEVDWPQSEGQIGSSAMAHKSNPIIAEQIGGLNRMAAGYAAMLQPLDLWLERDISNSSVERVAIPDLWHTLFRISGQTTAMLRDLHVDQAMTEEQLDNALAWVHKRTLDEVAEGTSLSEARESALIGAGYNDTGGTSARWFMRQYPQAGRS